MSTNNQSANIETHILRRFKILKKVGSGAYGHVWKVEDKGTGKIFALKKIFDAFQHATDAQRTYREIQILRQLDHPNIIKLFETLRAENERDVYLLFEFMEADLHNVVSEKILQEVHMRFIIYQVAKALKYLHSGGVIHRDIKPSNVLINSDCSVKICDFGLVRSLTTDSNESCLLTEGVATRWYRSPEVLTGSRSYSTPADIWSFGCIIYEMITQKPLFAGSSTLDQLEKICTFTGYPSEQDIDSIDSDISRNLLRQLKISQVKSQSSLKQLPYPFCDLFLRIMQFNPKKRMSIDEILKHELIACFRKPSEEFICLNKITTGINDNKKRTVDEYKKMIYGIDFVNSKMKILSTSLGTGHISPKFNPYHNRSVSTYQSTKQQLIKKAFKNTSPKKTYNDSAFEKCIKPAMKDARLSKEVPHKYVPHEHKYQNQIKNPQIAHEVQKEKRLCQMTKTLNSGFNQPGHKPFINSISFNTSQVSSPANQPFNPNAQNPNSRYYTFQQPVQKRSIQVNLHEHKPQPTNIAELSSKIEKNYSNPLTINELKSKIQYFRSFATIAPCGQTVINPGHRSPTFHQNFDFVNKFS